ncbi:V(D)J recombination-activating protein 1-like [Hydractinia symbiolongicarpus]|uniref:V(D)J recombination-activating protein 1-like n=1 Tax=Hydractinia symbiolongicarpus TaxID=13093 RepID=UPI00254C1872|nr:V(D)J recombination-activating protein 1-like [Hydractinia symbiolongicarpus]
MAEYHSEKINRLCRFCGQLLSKDTVLVSKHKSRLLKCFFIDVDQDSNEIHPTKMCLKCCSKLTHSEKRTTTSVMHEIHWHPHSENCPYCFEKLKRGRKTKKHKSGRPTAKKPIWTRILLNIFENTKDVVPPELTLEHLNTSLNPHVSLCRCQLCHNILRKPVTTTCEHTFCYNCLAPKILGKQ